MQRSGAIQWALEWHSYLVPVLILLVGIFISLLAKRKDDHSPAKNQIYVGQALVLSSISAAAVYVIKAFFSNRPDAGVPCLLLLLLYIFVLLVLAYIDKEHAWVATNVQGVAVHERKWWFGILIPNAVGFACFSFLFRLAKTQAL